MADKKEPWATIPVRQTVKDRMMTYKRPKPNRKKNEHYLETLETVLIRLMDFYDEHSPSVSGS